MNITISTAIEKYIEAKRVKGFSENTISAYSHTFDRFKAFLDEDRDVNQIDDETITQFLASIQGVSKKTKLNHHTGLSSLWTFLVAKDYVKHHVVREVERPDPTTKEVFPFSHHDVQALLATTDETQNPARNRAIILVLIDVGLRATELCNLRLREIDIVNQKLSVIGKGDKQRHLPFSDTTKTSIMKYMSIRKVDFCHNRNEHLFVAVDGHPFDRNGLSQNLERIAARANVYPGNPHRYRHTFAIQYLRNGGSIFTLQKILGHTALDMVKKYLSIAQCDLEHDHKIASPTGRRSGSIIIWPDVASTHQQMVNPYRPHHWQKG